MKKRLKQKGIRLFFLCATMCLSLCAASMNLVGLADAAETVNVKTTDIITLDTAAASVTAAKSHTALTYDGSELSYTGLTVGTANNAEPYSGKINGTFTGSTTIEYKFSGSSESYTKYDANNSAAWRGNNLGNFRWTITSVSDPTQTYTVEIYGTKNKSGKNASFTQIVGYKVRPTNTSETCSLQIFDFVPNPDAAKEITNFFNGGKDTGAPRFNTDGSDVREEIYFEQTADGLAISYTADKYNGYSYVDNSGRYGNYTANKGQKATITTLSAEEFDASQGYTISFCSDIDKELSDRYGVKFCSTINNVAIEEESSPITFLAINDADLSGEKFEVSYRSSEKHISNDGAVEINGKQFIKISSDATALPAFYFTRMVSPIGASGYSFPGRIYDAIESPDFNTIQFGESGIANTTASLEGAEQVFTVVKIDDLSNFDLIEVDSDKEGVTIKKETNVATAASEQTKEYDALNITGDGSYSGKFNGVFFGSNMIEFKFNGSSQVENEYEKNDGWKLSGKGDGLGDFYFVVTSVAAPSQSFEVRMTSSYWRVEEQTGYYSAVYSTLYLKTLDSNGNLFYYTFGNGYSGSASAHSRTTNEALALRSHPSAPYFHSDDYGVNGFMEHLYFDVDDNGIMSVSYDFRGNSAYSDNVINGGKGFPIAKFDGTEEYSIKNNQYGLPKLDLSKGYTISFGSDFDASKKYVTWLDGQQTEVDLEQLGIKGTDVCFTKVGGLNLTKDAVALNYGISVDYKGEYYEKDTNGDTLIYAMADSDYELSFTADYFINFTDTWYYKRNLVEKTFKLSDANINLSSATTQQGILTFDEESCFNGSYQMPCKLVPEPVYTIDLEFNGGHFADGSENIQYTEHIIPTLTDAVLPDVTFEGWFKEANFVTPVTKIEYSMGNTTLYAKWLDTTAPVIVLKDKPTYVTQLVNSASGVSKDDVLVTDNLDGEIPSSNIVITVKAPSASSFVTFVDTPFDEVGEYVIRYTVQDKAGFTSFVERTIRTLNRAAPVITLEEDVVKSGYTKYAFTVPSATASENATLSIVVVFEQNIVFEGSGTYMPTKAGRYTINYYAVNALGDNTSKEYSIEIIDDVVAPEIVLAEKQIEVLKDSTVTILQPVITDAVDANPSCEITVKRGSVEVQVSNGTFVAKEYGTYRITYKVQDLSGNTSETYYDVVVRSQLSDEGTVNGDGDTPGNGYFGFAGCAGCAGSIGGSNVVANGAFFSVLFCGMCIVLFRSKKKKNK